MPPLAEPEVLGAALGVEPELELAPLLGEELAPLLGEVEAPPEAEPEADPEAEPEGDFAGSVALEELEGPLGVVEAPPEGDVAEEELELEPEGGGVVALPLVLLLLLPVAPGAAGRSASLPHAARPKAMPTAIANVESFMCPPWLDGKSASKYRARPNPLMHQGRSRACRNLCRRGGSSYLPLPVDPGLAGLAGFFGALLGEPEVPPAPDGLELPEAEVPPLDDVPAC